MRLPGRIYNNSEIKGAILTKDKPLFCSRNRATAFGNSGFLNLRKLRFNKNPNVEH